MALVETSILLPSRVAQAIQTAERALECHPQGHLPLCLRRQIEMEFGTAQLAYDGTPSGIGWKRRVHLTILSVQRVQPIWKSVFPNNDGVECMLRLAQDVVADRADALDANQQMGDFWTQADNCRSQLRRRTGNSSAVCAGHAAAAAVAVALADKKPVDCASGEDDESGNYYDWDVSYFASIAYADGGLSNPNADIEKRRAFWKWYLQEAVPATFSISEE